MSAAARALDRTEVLVRLGDGPVPPLEPRLGKVVDVRDAGPLCTQRPDGVTIWAPAGAWWQAFYLVAMCKSASPDGCLVLTDELPPLELVPYDGRIAAVDGWCRGPVLDGEGVFACAELRNDSIFRLLLDGRARRRPRLEELLRLHLLTRTPHGSRVLQRWRDLLPILFGGGLEGMMPEGPRADLEELRQVARDTEHAITGGFHVLDRLVRRPSEWEAGARTYLRLAAAHSPSALAAIERWLQATAGWDLAPASRQEERRLTAARVLHRLVDDPWLPALGIADLLAEGLGL